MVGLEGGGILGRMDDIGPCSNVSGMQLQKKIVNPACPPKEGRPKALTSGPAGLELPHQGSQFLAAESFGEGNIELDRTLSFISWQRSERGTRDLRFMLDDPYGRYPPFAWTELS